MEILDENFKSPLEPTEIGKLHQALIMSIKCIKNAKVTFFILAGIIALRMILGFALVNKLNILQLIFALLYVIIGLSVSNNPKLILILGGIIFIAERIVMGFTFTSIVVLLFASYFVGKGIHESFEMEKIKQQLDFYGIDTSKYEA